MGFILRIHSQVHLDLHLSTNAEKETRYIQYGQLLLFPSILLTVDRFIYLFNQF
jgi:hypothetical protein